jgi:hypothetical protein
MSNNGEPGLGEAPGPDNTEKANRGTAGVGFLVAIVFGIFVLSGWLYTAFKQNDPGVQTCSTTCLGFIRFERRDSTVDDEAGLRWLMCLFRGARRRICSPATTRGALL